MTPSDPLEAALALAQALEAAGISYALGGALAYGIWGIPRATLDVDINIFVEDDELSKVADALASLGIHADPERLRSESQAHGLCVVRYGPYRVDLFTPSIAFSREAERTRREIEIEGKRAYFLSAQALAVFKLLFFRPKDIVDLERLVEVQGDALDVSYVRRELIALMGEDDERVRRWDELTAPRYSAEA
jgi:hypothetical protein